jgi:large subunit ribosomal protein L3
MTKKMMGKKRGMTQVFDDKGNLTPCTIIEAQANVITQVKTTESDGYNAIQIGFEPITAKDPRREIARTKKPQRGHFGKNDIKPRRFLQEVRVDSVENYSPGQELTVQDFEGIKHVDVSGVSKGKGYQGVMKLHNFSGGPAAHGSGFHRHAGSTGMRSTPGRCLPGGKRASQMGNRNKTVQNLEIVKVIPEDSIILIKGQVPGPTGALVTFAEAVKKPSTKN